MGAAKSNNKGGDGVRQLQEQGTENSFHDKRYVYVCRQVNEYKEEYELHIKRGAGVSSVAIEGDSKDRVVVTGEDVDTVCLGRKLRKKFRSVTVLTVEEVKPKKDNDKGKEKEKPKTLSVCVAPPAYSCVRCWSSKCDGGCKPCCKCQSHRCDGDCKPCSKCESHKCEGGCKACFRCGSYRCHGHCASVICYGQCPPWLSCPSCCSKALSALCYNVVYDPTPTDSCSIQ